MRRQGRRPDRRDPVDLRPLRDAAGLTQAEAAQICEKSLSMYKLWEAQRSAPMRALEALGNELADYTAKIREVVEGAANGGSLELPVYATDEECLEKTGMPSARYDRLQRDIYLIAAYEGTMVQSPNM